PVEDPTPIPPVSTPIQPIDFSGTVFEDKDGDGVRDLGEAGVAGRTVFADANGNAALDAGEKSAVTDSAGHYKLSVAPGDYTLRQVLPTGWYSTAASASSATVSAASVGGTANFAAAKYATLSGGVFRDANHNGLRDAGEAGLAGATVFIDANNNG